MPKNYTGGSKVKGARNSEGDKARKNRLIGDALLDDYLSGSSTAGVHVGRVTKKFGHGRMEVLVALPDRMTSMNVPLRGGLKGRGKQHVWVDVDNIVIVAENDVGGYEIIAVLSNEQRDQLKKIRPEIDDRIFAKGTTETPSQTGFEFDADVDIDAL